MSGAVKALAWADRPRISPSTDKRTIECRSCEVFVSAFKDGGSLFFRFLTNFDLFFSFHGPLLKTADASERGVNNHRRMVCLLPIPHYEAYNLLVRGCAGVFRTGACSLEHGGPKSCVRVYAGRGVCVCDQ